MEIEEIKKLNVKDGDTLVFRCPSALTYEQRRSMEGHALSFAKGVGNVKVMILDAGMTLDVLTKDDV